MSYHGLDQELEMRYVGKENEFTGMNEQEHSEGGEKKMKVDSST